MKQPSLNEKFSQTPRQFLLPYLSFAVSIISIVWLLQYCYFGLDFTDESFYLLWMANPFMYPESVSQFGFIYHPVYRLLDGNIAAIRRANILVTLALSWILVSTLLRSLQDKKKFNLMMRNIVALGVATSSLTMFAFAGLWLPTPSYNSLAFDALLIFATGLILAERHTSCSSFSGWLLIGVSGWMAFMAKPPTAALMGLWTTVYLLLAQKNRPSLLAVSFVTSIVLIGATAVAIDGSIAAFYQRIKGGLELNALLDDGSSGSIFRIDSITLPLTLQLHLIIDTFAIVCIFFLYVAANRIMRLAAYAVLLTLGLISLAIIFGLLQHPLGVNSLQGLLLCAAPIGAVLFSVWSSRLEGFLSYSLSRGPLLLTFLALPYVFAFGTGNNYWILMACASLFYVLAGLIFLAPFNSLLLPFCISVQTLTIAIVQSGLESPYRQPEPLTKNNVEAEIAHAGNTLMLTKNFARYISDASNLANAKGFSKETPMIDLTGRSPGLLYALGARNIGQPWLFGGHPGSDVYAESALKKVPCEDLASAWLLVEPHNPSGISPQVLSTFGAKIETDFETVGIIATDTRAPEADETRTQNILKPIRALGVAVDACRSTRSLGINK